MTNWLIHVIFHCFTISKLRLRKSVGCFVLRRSFNAEYETNGNVQGTIKDKKWQLKCVYTYYNILGHSPKQKVMECERKTKY